MPPLAAGSDPDGWNRLAPTSPMLQNTCYKCFTCFISILYIVSVSYGCCKSISECCIYCNGCTCMFQASVPNVSSIFSDVCCKCVYLDVTYVSHICCKCFIWTLHMFFNGFSSVFASVLRHVLQVLHLDVSKVDRVLHLAPSMPLATSPRCLHLLSAPVGHPN